MTDSPDSVALSHQYSDVDSSATAQHHSLGSLPTQAAPGSHTHDGISSKQFPVAEFFKIAKNDAAITVPANGVEIATLWNTVFDWANTPVAERTGIWDAGQADKTKITIPKTGHWLVSWACPWSPSGASIQLLGHVDINGSGNYCAPGYHKSASGGVEIVKGSEVIPLNAGDYIRLLFNSGAGTTPGTSISAGFYINTYITLKRLGLYGP